MKPSEEKAMLRILAAAALVMTPAAALAQTVPAPDYVKQAGASDLYERESSKLVLASKDMKVRSFAADMIKAHTKSTADVKAAAMKAGIAVPPPKLTPEQAGNIAQLKAASPANRDKLYVEQQKMAHAQALSLQKSYAAKGEVPSLKMTAAAIVPVVQHHVHMLNGM